MSTMTTTAERLLALRDDPDSVTWSWAVIIIGAGGVRHTLAAEKGVVSYAYRFADGSALHMPEFGSEGSHAPTPFTGTFNSGYAFKK